MEDFVKWLRRQRRTRNGAQTGRQAHYTTTGIQLILSTCRTAFNWAKKRRHPPPYAENPFTSFPIEQLRGRAQTEVQVLTPDQQHTFFEECDNWQGAIFSDAGGLRHASRRRVMLAFAPDSSTNITRRRSTSAC